jgi:hypothetical protein
MENSTPDKFKPPRPCHPKPGGKNPRFETEIEFRLRESQARRRWYRNKKAKKSRPL